MQKWKCILQSNFFFLFLFFLTFFICLYSFLKKDSSKFSSYETEVVGRVETYKIDGNLLSFTLRSKEKVIVNYTIKSEEEKKELQEKFGYGIKVSVEGSLKEPKKNTIPNTFNYKEYLYYQKIHYLMASTKITKIEDENFLNSIKNKITKYLSSLPNSLYLKAFLLGNTTLFDMDDIRQNGVSHLFAVSGMHISLFVSVLSFLLKKWQKIGSFLISFFLIFYAFLVSFTPSVMRVILMYFGKKINEKIGNPLPNKKIFFLCLSSMLLYNPYYLKNIGFLYSFLISYCFFYLDEEKNYLKGLLKTSIIAFLASLPITMINFYEVNVLSIFLNLLFVPFVSFLIYPMCFLVLLCPFLTFIFTFLLFLFESLSAWCANIKCFTFVLAKVPNFLWLLYYLIFACYLKKSQKKYLVALVLFLGVIKCIPLMNPFGYVYFIDVGQGDSTLFISPHQKEIFLIDTGGKVSFKEEEWKVRQKKVNQGETLVTFFHSLGINRLDYLVLTHGDMDHLGNALTILEKMNVKQIVLNKNEQNIMEKLIAEKYKEKISEQLKSEEFTIKEFTSKNTTDENDASLIYQISLFSKSFLLSGDASQSVEKTLLSKNIKSDVLKLGHHGSKTSSAPSFLKKVNPEYIVISVGENNRYGHPNEETITSLKELQIPYYTTMEYGTIGFEIKKNKMNFFPFYEKSMIK